MSTTVLDSLISSAPARKKNESFALQGSEKTTGTAKNPTDATRKDKTFASHVDHYTENETIESRTSPPQTKPVAVTHTPSKPSLQNTRLDKSITTPLHPDAQNGQQTDYKENSDEGLLAVAIIAPEQVSASAPVDLITEAPAVSIDFSTAEPDLAAMPTAQPVTPETGNPLPASPLPAENPQSAPTTDAAQPTDTSAQAILAALPVGGIPAEGAIPAEAVMTTAAPEPAPLPTSVTTQAQAPKTASAATVEQVIAKLAVPENTLASQPAAPQTQAASTNVTDDAAGDSHALPEGTEIADDVPVTALKQEATATKQNKTTPILVPDATASGAGAKETTATPQNRTGVNPATLGAGNTQNAAQSDAGTSNGGANSDASPQQSKFVDMLSNKTPSTEQQNASREKPTFAQTVSDAFPGKAGEALHKADAPDMPQQQLATNQNTTPTHRTYPPQIMAQVPAAMVQLGVEIAARHRKGTSQFDIRLDPAELGRVDVRIEIDRHGRIKSHLFVEKAETLELLKADLRGLERTLEQAGLRTDNGSLSLNLRDPSQGNNPFKDADGQPFFHHTQEETSEAETVMVQLNYQSTSNDASGVDIRV